MDCLQIPVDPRSQVSMGLSEAGRTHMTILYEDTCLRLRIGYKHINSVTKFLIVYFVVANVETTQMICGAI